MVKIVTGLEIESLTKLQTGISKIDQALQGGLPTNGLLEICGESASGKTQLCLQMAITSFATAKAGSFVVYISTEGVFPSKRLVEMLASTTSDQSKDYASRILVEHVTDLASLMHLIKYKLENLLKNHSVHLLIVDSVAALFRGTSGFSRTCDLRDLGKTLLHLNFSFGITVLTVNQMTACIERNSTVPALGLAWTNLVTSRIQLHRLEGPVRRLNVVFSSSAPKIQEFLVITEKGLEDYYFT